MPDATQAEIAEQLPVKVHQSMVGRELRILKLTYKKTVYAAEQDRQDVAEKRAEWKVRQAGLDPKNLYLLTNREQRRT